MPFSKEVLLGVKIDELAWLVEDPSKCNSTIGQNPCIKKIDVTFERTIKFQNLFVEQPLALPLSAKHMHNQFRT